MAYTKEQLYDFPVSKLVSIILDMQDSMEETNALKKKISKIASIIGTIDSQMAILGNSSTSLCLCDSASETKGKRGRKPMTMEQRAEAYERQKARQKEKYHEMMVQLKGYKAQEAQGDTFKADTE